MNATNIAAFAHVTPAVYRTWPLQAQIDAWTALTVSALGASSVSQLRSMSSFDGMPTDAYMQLSCIQMGIGNCQTMINSGRCEGWRDSNGTSICKMAAKMQGLSYTPGTGTGTPTPAPTPTPSSTSGNNSSAFIPTPGTHTKRFHGFRHVGRQFYDWIWCIHGKRKHAHKDNSCLNFGDVRDQSQYWYMEPVSSRSNGHVRPETRWETDSHPHGLDDDGLCVLNRYYFCLFFKSAYDFFT